MTLQAFQQLTWANYFFYYGATIFQSVGISNSFVTQIILGDVNVGCTFPGLWFIERYGRRKPLIIGGLWQCAWLIVFAAVGSQFNPADRGVGDAMIVSACMFIVGYIHRICLKTLIGSDMHLLGAPVSGLLSGRCFHCTSDPILLLWQRQAIGLGTSSSPSLHHSSHEQLTSATVTCLLDAISWPALSSSFSTTSRPA
jgi:Sugar (and other) transporter